MTLLITRYNVSHLEPGDLTEFKRGVYSHWAVYKGDEEVVHLAGEDGDGIDSNVQHLFSIGGKLYNKACVRIDNIWKAAAGNKTYKNNANDHKLTPLRKQDIVERAVSKLGEVTYNIIYKNCEHFANWCRYDTEKSGQVESFATSALVGLAALAVVGFASYMFSGSDKEKKSRTQSN